MPYQYYQVEKHDEYMEVGKKMKSTAILVNTARGRVVDEAALAKAIKAVKSEGRRWMCLKKSPVFIRSLSKWKRTWC